MSLALLTTNTYDQLLSYVVFADWLFFGLTAAGLLIMRHREPRPRGDIAYVPGHPVTTSIFILVAGGVVVNSFITYPTQSLVGATILAAATASYFVMKRTSTEQRKT